MLIDYYKGIQTSTSDKFNAPLIVFTAFTAGYTISHFHPDFLHYLGTPVGQFIIYYIILYSLYRNDQTVSNLDIIIETTIYVIFIQVLKYIINWYFTRKYVNS